MTAIVHPSVDERSARGKAAREQVPPSAHAGWAPAADRPDPVALLEEQNATREPDLVPVRHGRMMVSPFTFYRGAAKIMAADLKDTPTAGLNVQLCGDAHLSNFGVFASPERTLAVRPERLRRDASRAVRVRREAHGGELHDRGAQQRLQPSPMRAPRRSRRSRPIETQMAEFAEMRTMDIWYARLSEQELMSGDQGRGARHGTSGQQEGRQDRGEDRREAGTKGAHPRQLAGAVEAGRARRRPVPDRQPAAGRDPVARPGAAASGSPSTSWST